MRSFIWRQIRTEEAPAGSVLPFRPFSCASANQMRKSNNKMDFIFFYMCVTKPSTHNKYEFLQSRNCRTVWILVFSWLISGASYRGVDVISPHTQRTDDLKIDDIWREHYKCSTPRGSRVRLHSNYFVKIVFIWSNQTQKGPEGGRMAAM